MWTTWSESGSISTHWTQSGVAVRCSLLCSYFNSVLCHSTESEPLYFQSFFPVSFWGPPLTRPNSLPPPTLPKPVYSLLNLIDRSRYLWWVSGQQGFGDGTDMSMHGDCIKVISIFLLSHCYIFSNLWWMICLASGGMRAGSQTSSTVNALPDMKTPVRLLSLYSKGFLKCQAWSDFCQVL